MTDPDLPIVVFDCMIYLQATTRPNGPAAKCLRLAEQKCFKLLISDDVVCEIVDVLGRSRIRAKNPHLTEEVVGEFMKQVRIISDFVAEVEHHFSFARDPKDEPYLNLAVTGNAVYLVSRDRDLLDLMSEQSEEAIEFRSRFPQLTILPPVEFLRVFEQETN